MSREDMVAKIEYAIKAGLRAHPQAKTFPDGYPGCDMAIATIAEEVLEVVVDTLAPPF